MAEKVTVRSGQTLSSIAKANGTTVAAIKKANPVLTTNPKYNGGNRIFAGTKLVIPGKTTTKTTTTPVVTSNPITVTSTSTSNPFTSNTDASAGSSTTVPMTTDRLSMAQLQKEFGITAAVINNDPSLLAALNRILGVDGGPMITDAALQEAIVKGTSWYRDQTDTQRSV
jgi:LysM repeat protein